mgnify:CR=1 FL=1
MHFEANFQISVLILPLFLGRFVDRDFDLRLHSASNFHVSDIGFVTPLEKLCSMSFASRMHFKTDVHIFGLAFAIVYDGSINKDGVMNTCHFFRSSISITS